MKIHTLSQGSDEWHRLKLGKISGSQCNKILGTKVGAESYMSALVRQHITGKKKDDYTSVDMHHGIEREAQAIAHYQLQTSQIVDRVGFIEKDNLCGCSPDGFVLDDGIIEVKCPTTETHIKTILLDEIPKSHLAQCFFNLWVSHRKWCDFISFSSELFDLGKKHFLFVKRLHRDEEINITKDRKISVQIIEKKVTEFSAQLKRAIEKWSSL